MFGFFKRKKPQAEVPPPPPSQQPLTDSSDDEDAGDPQLFIANIPELAETHVEMSKDTLGVTLDYSVESLSVIDEIISTHWEESPVFLDQIVIAFGAYVGETIRRQHGGSWVFDEERGYTLAGLGGADIRIYPFAKVYKRFTNGEEDSIAFFYKVVSKAIADQKTDGGRSSE